MGELFNLENLWSTNFKTILNSPFTSLVKGLFGLLNSAMGTNNI